MRRVLITGTTSGFGRSLVEVFLENGDQVYATGRNLNTREEIFSELKEKHQDNLKLYDLDITDKAQREQIGKLFKNTELDILINNAGIGHFGALENSSEEELRLVFETNFFGLTLLTQELLPSLRQSKGHIINISSILGLTGFPTASIYCASKYAVEGLSESLAHELKPHGVKVSLIEPGGYRTQFANNSMWSSEDSIYKNQVSGLKAFMEKAQTKTKFQRPEDLAKDVLNISLKKKPSLSYVMGKDAKASKFLKGLLSRQIYFNLMQKFFRKTIWS